MNPAVDLYIEQAAPFARPVLQHLRALVHQHCPQVQEQLKWGMPFFCLKHNLCFMAAFQAHCGFGFWRSDALGLPATPAGKAAAMGQLGKICSLADLPADSWLAERLQQAVALDQSPRSQPKQGRRPATPLMPPAEWTQALAGNAPAAAFFDRLSVSQQNEYIEWLLEAKTAATRQKRLQTSLEWLAEQKLKNWKYMK